MVPAMPHMPIRPNWTFNPSLPSIFPAACLDPPSKAHWHLKFSVSQMNVHIGTISLFPLPWHSSSSSHSICLSDDSNPLTPQETGILLLPPCIWASTPKPCQVYFLIISSSHPSLLYLFCCHIHPSYHHLSSGWPLCPPSYPLSSWSDSSSNHLCIWL